MAEGSGEDNNALPHWIRVYPRLLNSFFPGLLVIGPLSGRHASAECGLALPGTELCYRGYSFKNMDLDTFPHTVSIFPSCVYDVYKG